MKITNTLPQFEGTTALIIVASVAHLEFYRASNGSIVKAESSRIEPPGFTDKEGYFATSTGGKNLKVASARDSQFEKRDAIQRFEKRFKSLAKEVASKKEYGEVIIFSPEYFKNEVADNLPKKLQDKVSVVIKGNFHKIHPFELLKKIETKRKSRKKEGGQKEPTKTKEARKILSKSRKAAKKIKDPRSLK